MRRNLRFCIIQLGREWPGVLIKMIQVTLSLLFLGALINDFVQQTALHRQIGNVQGEKQVYVLQDNNSDEYLDEIFNDEKYRAAFQKLVDAVMKSGTEFIVMNNVMTTTMNYNQTDIIEVTHNFFRKYGLTGKYEEAVLEKEFQIKTTDGRKAEQLIRPAILGNAYRKKYSAGELFEDDWGNSYKVVGFLDPQQFYAAPIQGTEMNPLDNAIITPVYINIEDNESMYDFLYGCQFLVENISELDSLMQINREEKLLDTWLQSYDAQIRYVDEAYQNAAVMQGTMGCCLMIFAFTGIVCSMLRRLEDHTYEYSVNLLCGARYGDIFFRILFESVLIFAGADIVCLAVFKISLASELAAILSLLCIPVLFLAAYLRIDFVNLTKNLRNRE